MRDGAVKPGIGRRGAYLLVKSVMFAVHGILFITLPLTSSLRSTLTLPLAIAPLPFWGCVWFTAGLVAGFSAFQPSPAKDRWGFLVLITVASFWAVSYTWSAIAGFNAGAFGRGLIGAALYASLAGVIVVVSGWNEPR